MEHIPHRPPILAVDRVLSVDDEAVTAERVIGPGPDVGQDGLLWEQALVEGLAQTAAAFNGRAARTSPTRSEQGRLVGVRRFRIERRPRIGERIQYRVRLVRSIRPLSLIHGTVHADDELLAEGDLKFYVEESL